MARLTTRAAQKRLTLFIGKLDGDVKELEVQASDSLEHLYSEASNLVGVPTDYLVLKRGKTILPNNDGSLQTAGIASKNVFLAHRMERTENLFCPKHEEAASSTPCSSLEDTSDHSDGLAKGVNKGNGKSFSTNSPQSLGNDNGKSGNASSPHSLGKSVVAGNGQSGNTNLPRVLGKGKDNSSADFFSHGRKGAGQMATTPPVASNAGTSPFQMTKLRMCYTCGEKEYVGKGVCNYCIAKVLGKVNGKSGNASSPHSLGKGVAAGNGQSNHCNPDSKPHNDKRQTRQEDLDELD